MEHRQRNLKEIPEAVFKEVQKVHNDADNHNKDDGHSMFTRVALNP